MKWKIIKNTLASTLAPECIYQAIIRRPACNAKDSIHYELKITFPCEKSNFFTIITTKISPSKNNTTFIGSKIREFTKEFSLEIEGERLIEEINILFNQDHPKFDEKIKVHIIKNFEQLKKRKISVEQIFHFIKNSEIEQAFLTAKDWQNQEVYEALWQLAEYVRKQYESISLEKDVNNLYPKELVFELYKSIDKKSLYYCQANKIIANHFNDYMEGVDLLSLAHVKRDHLNYIFQSFENNVLDKAITKFINWYNSFSDKKIKMDELDTKTMAKNNYLHSIIEEFQVEDLDDIIDYLLIDINHEETEKINIAMQEIELTNLSNPFSANLTPSLVKSNSQDNLLALF